MHPTFKSAVLVADNRRIDKKAKAIQVERMRKRARLAKSNWTNKEFVDAARRHYRERNAAATESPAAPPEPPADQPGDG